MQSGRGVLEMQNALFVFARRRWHLLKRDFNSADHGPPPPGVSWNVFIRQGLGAILVDRFDSIGVRGTAPKHGGWGELRIEKSAQAIENKGARFWIETEE